MGQTIPFPIPPCHVHWAGRSRATSSCTLRAWRASGKRSQRRHLVSPPGPVCRPDPTGRPPGLSAPLCGPTFPASCLPQPCLPSPVPPEHVSSFPAHVPVHPQCWADPQIPPASAHPESTRCRCSLPDIHSSPRAHPWMEIKWL